jgi:hypothetical protein
VSATAQNESQTWQAIFQVQQGCRSHCQGTSQSQSADQYAETIQKATAIGGGKGTPSSATALNQSTTAPPVAATPPGEPAPTIAPTSGASSSRSPKTFVERVTATWRRVSGHGRSEARIRRSSAATALSGPRSGLTMHTRVESSSRVEAGSSTAKAHTSATTSTSTTTGSDTSSPDFPPVLDEPLSGLEKPDWGFSTAGWILIGLLLACGVALLRKTHLRRPVV